MQGDWLGHFSGQGPDLEFRLRIFEGGALFSVPSQMLFGLPVAEIRLKGNEFFCLISKEQGEIILQGKMDAQAIRGAYSRSGQKIADFSLSRSVLWARPGKDFSVRSKAGKLSGTLLEADPKAFPGRGPIALILADSGPSDRDGNNYNNPGRSDCLSQLADALAEIGIASLRYDKRGAGESYPLVRREEDLRFSDYVDDAVQALQQLKALGKYPEIYVIGHGEGSLVGSLASRRVEVDGFISLAGPGLPAWMGIQDQLEALSGPDGLDKAVWRSMLDSLKSGKTISPPIPEDYQSMFRPSIQAYLISWIALDPKEELAKLHCPILILQGGNDVRVGPDDTRALEAGAPKAKEVFLPDMTHSLKAILNIQGEHEKANSDPGYPLAAGLKSVLGEFIFGAK